MPTIQSIMAQEKAKNSIASHQYPANLGPHYVLFEFMDFKTDSVQATIALPLPSSMTDSTEVNVGSENLGSVGAAILGLLDSKEGSAGEQEALEMIRGMEDSISAVGGNAAQAFMGGSILQGLRDTLGANRFFARGAIDSISPAAGTAVDLATGTTVNPHTTLNFDGVNLKAHNFTWTLSPSSSQEADDIHEMVKEMKIRSLPRYEGPKGVGRKALLSYPDKVQTTFSDQMKTDHFYSGVIKKAMVTNVSIDYSPSGVALNKSGTPALMNLNLSLLEQEIHTREDY